MKASKPAPFLICLIGWCLSVPLAAAPSPVADNLRCEFQTGPVAIDVTRPGLSWNLSSAIRGAGQTAYQILVASSPSKLTADQGDLWDSGKVESDRSVHVEYAGKVLVSRQSCHWKVRVWLDGGKTSGWSKPATWTMALLAAEDWQAKWIRFPSVTTNEAQYFRKDVMLEKPVKRGIARFACLGFADILINGRKPDESLMIAPRFANPAYRVIHTTLDVPHTPKHGGPSHGRNFAKGHDQTPSTRVE